MRHVTRKSERDKQVIQFLVREFGQLSRVEIHKLTYLRLNTISSLVRELLIEGRLVEAGRGKNPSGRKQILLGLNHEHSLVVGVEFDDEWVLASTMDLSLKTKSTIKEPTYLDAGMEGLIRQLLSCTRRAIEQTAVQSRPLIGIGIADPGLVNTREGVVVTCTTIDFWKQVPLKGIFEREFEIPVLLESKTRARAVAERMLGAGELAEDMVYIDYGTGIGAGIILDGKLLRGHRSALGEFGHTQMGENTTACKCGSFGCLEAIAGAVALKSRILKAISQGSTSQALALAGGNPDKISAWTVLAAARLGDKTCSAIVEQAGDCLGLGLANLVNLFNPSLILLDRRLEQAGQGLLDQIVRVVRRQALSHSTEDLEIRFAKLGEEAGVLGVGLMLLERHFEIPQLRLPRFMIESISEPGADGSATQNNLTAKQSFGSAFVAEHGTESLYSRRIAP
jgi:predicted NBD/HSP70 family sugar kinase